VKNRNHLSIEIFGATHSCIIYRANRTGKPKASADPNSRTQNIENQKEKQNFNVLKSKKGGPRRKVIKKFLWPIEWMRLFQESCRSPTPLVSGSIIHSITLSMMHLSRLLVRSLLLLISQLSFRSAACN